MTSKINPGLAGWAAVAASVAIADGYAKSTRKPTMSDEFNHFFSWAAPIGAAVFAHLVLHKRKDTV